MLVKKGQAAISLVCVVLGIMLAVQFRSNQDFRYSLQNQRAEDLTLRLSSAEKERDSLQSQVRELQTSGGNASYKELQRTAMGAGTIALAGPGIVVTVEEDRKPTAENRSSDLYFIRAEDMLKILNELRAGGAEAIAINNQRLITGSGIRQNGQSMSVNGTPFAAPFEIRAIGDPATLENSLKMRGGVIETLSFWGIKITVSQKPDVQIPAYTGGFQFQHAHPMKEAGK
ncbi:DUF881 domain-containing protein [Sporomusa malonica]|uniref:Uncharacterized conserved protein YlxW, UPF0749 family n=1 Tax=Sporomusa malonica TaxID=112901 RepID=A0A1W2C5U0_9FIRM|nr:DUF881 domain-containing protein [Sporomusa malonica]SMC80471.1 Uncharacterized conserved protein YlxW, UPF0749 family [Sporomusa malonica]